MKLLEYFKNPLYISIVVYVLSIVLILHNKPKIFFNKDGQMKQTGCGGNNKTIFSFPMYIVVSSIIIYFLVCYLNE